MTSLRDSILKSLSLVLLLIGLAAGAMAAAPARPLPASFDPVVMMPLSEIRPGMKGHLQTVYSGTTLEQTACEILGVFPGFMAGRDLIIARLDLPWKDMGIIGGMSGSPVFINERMIGAVAYGWGFSKDAIAGVTPIEYMMEVFDTTREDGAEDDEPEPGAIVQSQSGSGPGGGWRGAPASAGWTAQRPWFKEAAPSLQRPEWQSQMQGLGLGTNDGQIEAAALLPLRLPLSVSSNNPLTLGLLQRAFGDYGMMPVSAGGRAAKGGAAAKEGGGGAFIPAPGAADITHGSALGVAYMTGDLSLAAIGTATYREGSKLVAFGHPMMQDGEAAMPMTSAVITTVMPSYINPFKLGYAGDIIGTLKQDRLPAVGGAFGAGPEMTPFRLAVQVDGRPAEEFHFQMTRHRDVMPILALIGVMEGLNTAADFGGDQTAEVAYSLTLAGGETIRKNMFFTGAGLTAFGSAFDLMMDAGMMLFNPYEQTQITALDFDIKIRHEMKQMQLWTARVNRDVYQPGDTVRLSLFLQPWREKMEVRRLEFALPAELTPGAYRLHVLSGNDRARLEANQNPGRFQMRDFEDVVRVLNIYYPDNMAFVILERGQGGVSLEGEAIQAPPPSVKALLEETAPDFQTAPVRGQTLQEERLTLDVMLSGSQTIPLKVERKKETF